VFYFLNMVLLNRIFLRNPVLNFYMKKDNMCFVYYIRDPLRFIGFARKGSCLA